MMDTKEHVLQLVDALENRGVTQERVRETVANILLHKVDIIYWNDANKERIALHAFLLARTRSFLQECLAQDSKPDGRNIIEQQIHEIDEHFSARQWPSDIREDDPVLLKQFWNHHKQNGGKIAAKNLPAYVSEFIPVTDFRNERNRILRILLKLPVTVSHKGGFEPVLTHDLVNNIQTSTDRFVRAIIGDELQERYPDAYGFISVMHGHRDAERLNKLLDFKKMSSQGFLGSILQRRSAIQELLDNLNIALDVLGKLEFNRITQSWDSLDKIKWMAVFNQHRHGVNLGGYQLACPVEYSESQMPPWMEGNMQGELKNEGYGDAGSYILFSDRIEEALPDGKVKEKLRAQYANLQENLIKQNYDALHLIMAHSDKMTKITAQTIIALVNRMMETYQDIADSTDSVLVARQYHAFLQELEESWKDLSPGNELPAFLRNKIIKIQECSPVEIDSVHSWIRFLHDAGNKSLEKRMVSARSDRSITIGRIGISETKEIQLAKLDNNPIIVNGLIRHRAISIIISAVQRMPFSMPGTFVVINNHISYSVKLGEHRVEFSANIECPDNEGFVQLQIYQGGVEIEQQLRGAFIKQVLQERGIIVACEQEGLVDLLVRGILDKDHGARNVRQIEQAVLLVLRLIGSLRDLDYAMAYILLKETTPHPDKKINSKKIYEFAVSFARMFLVEGMIPFSYGGEGMPFSTYCEYGGPEALRGFRAYHSDEQRMIRYRLFFTINACLQSVDLPTIKPGTGGIGQQVIDEYFNQPIINALGRSELIINLRGFVERNPVYQPVKDIISTVVSRENEALRMASLLRMAALDLDFHTIGSIDQLMLVRAQQEIKPNAWLVVYGLVDDENHAVLYAFCQYIKTQGEQEWLSVAKLRKLLRISGYPTIGKIQIPGFQKAFSHRLLTGRPHENSMILGVSIRGLLASVGDGSVRIGRITLDRNYCFNPLTRDGRVLLVPFTTPEDIEAIRNAEAVLVTSGGLLSHAGVTTREFSIPALIIPHAEWIYSEAGVMVRLEDRHPSQMRRTAEGFWVSDSMIYESVDVREGDLVLVWASQGMISIMPMNGKALEQVHGFIQDILSEKKTPIDLEKWLVTDLLKLNIQDKNDRGLSDIIGLILAEALWDKRIRAALRKELIDIVQRTHTGICVDGRLISVPPQVAAYIKTVLRKIEENAFTEFESLLSEVEHNISRIQVLWRALNIVQVVEQFMVQVRALANSMDVFEERLQAFENRVDRLRRHPRIALLRASMLHEAEILSGKILGEADLPLIQQTLRRLGHAKNSGALKKVLLVCTANVDRSPMAEFLLRKMFRDENVRGMEVISRGVAASENCPMSATGQALLMLEDQINANTHCSGKLAETDINGADIVLAMECFHVQFLKEKYPHAADRIFLLSEYGNMRELGDIKDPAGQSEDAYYRMKRELQICLTGALKHMRDDGLLAKAMIAHLRIKADELAGAKRKRIAESRVIAISMEDISADSVELVGGKGANLGEIAQLVKHLGAQVPTAFMVTTFAFQRFLEENSILDEFTQLTAAIDNVLVTENFSDQAHRNQVLELSDKIRKLISHGQLDVAAGVGLAIMEALDAHGFEDAFLSVRSSGLQEDTEEATFAGAAETYLYVNPAELLEWIKKVWMSFWLIRGILYRKSRLVQQGPIKPAIIVQRMFDSQVSGVMFTTDPVSGRDVLVIEAGYGLGEGVVSGLVDVDRYYVNKFDGSLINIHIGNKAFKVTRHPSGKGTSIESVESHLRNIPCLSEENIRIQTRIAMALEKHYALSQDIEFGIADGKVSILQTRPITMRVSYSNPLTESR